MTLEGLSKTLFVNGVIQADGKGRSLVNRQENVSKELTRFGGLTKLIEENQKYPVYLSQTCFELQEKLISELVNN